MFEGVLQDLKKDVKKAKEATEIVLGRTKRKTAISDEKFVPITAPPFSGKACFVDGGNAAVYESPDARVELVRVYATVYEGKKRIASRREEGLVLVQNATINDKGLITAKGYGKVELTLTIPADDPGLRLGKERVTLAAVANLCRFALECRFAARVAQENGCDLLVRDGSLEGINGYEERELGGLLKQMKDVVGFSKTTTLLTADGGSAAAALLERGPTGAWLYDAGELIIDDDKDDQSKNDINDRSKKDKKGRDDGRIHLFLLKLHGRSEHAFRVDAKAEDITGIVSFLASVSADPVFPGYPYPLIEADRMARVTNQELEGVRTRFQAEAGADWRALKRRSRGSDAHGILDRIS